MRYLRFVVAGLVLFGMGPPSLHAASSAKAQCKKIRDAVWAGKTIEQITAEFDTDPETVMKCTQKKGKRKKAPQSQKKSTQKSAKSNKSQSSAGTSSAEAKSQAPSVSKPPVPRSGGRSAHQP